MRGSYMGFLKRISGKGLWGAQHSPNKTVYGVAKSLNTPRKIYRFIRRKIQVVDGGPEDLQEILDTHTASQLGVACLAAELLYRNKYPTYIMFVGYKLGKLYPFALTFNDKYAVSIGEVMKYHTPDPFQIMRDYVPDGTRWIITDVARREVLASYSEGRVPYEVTINLESKEMQKLVFGQKTIY